jgi:hypothetical protein
MSTEATSPILKSSVVQLKSRLIPIQKTLSLCYITTPEQLKLVFHTLFPSDVNELENISAMNSQVLGNLSVGLLTCSPVLIVQSMNCKSCKFYLLSSVISFFDELDTGNACSFLVRTVREDLKFVCESSVEYLSWIAAFKSGFHCLALLKDNYNDPLLLALQEKEKDVENVRKSLLMQLGDHLSNLKHSNTNMSRHSISTSTVDAIRPPVPMKSYTLHDSPSPKRTSSPLVRCGSFDDQKMQWNEDTKQWQRV